MYRLPDQFLSGTTEVPYHWRHDVPLTRELSSAEWVALDCFKWRAGEFLLNIDDLKLPRRLTGSTRRHHVAGISVNKGQFTSNVWPGRFRAKSVFLDFRPLILSKGDDSRSSFKRTKNIVSRYTSDKVLLAFVSNVSENFLSESTELSVDSNLPEEDRIHSVEALLDLWINTYFFHNGTSEQSRKVGEIQTIFEPEGVEQLLFFELIQLAHLIRCLYSVVDKTAPSNPFFSCPDDRLVSE